MFEALDRASPSNKYQVRWVALDRMTFIDTTQRWLAQLQLPRIRGGASSADRISLAVEFQALVATFRGLVAQDARGGYASLRVQMINRNIDAFRSDYKRRFGHDLPPVPTAVPREVARIEDDLSINAARRAVLETKKELVRYWIEGLKYFPDHQDDVSLTWQYMGNAVTSKVRMHLDVLVKDAERMTATIDDPRPWLRVRGEADRGFGYRPLGEGGQVACVKWTEENFRWALKAEAAMAYGWRASGECSIEVTGLKAELKADAFVGISARAEFEASGGVGRGLQVKAGTEVMIGVKIKFEANVDVADIFLAEASAEAFAGAMAKAEVEVKATIDGVAVKLEAEAFAGARVKGKAGLTLRLAGYDIIKGETEAYVSAGVGAEFKFGFESSAFSGTKVEVKAGATVGVGMGGDAKFTVYSDNLGRAANSIFYTAYLTMAGQGRQKHTWTTYFRALEDNMKLLERADGIIDQYLVLNRQRLDLLTTQNRRVQELHALM